MNIQGRGATLQPETPKRTGGAGIQNIGPDLRMGASTERWEEREMAPGKVELWQEIVGLVQWLHFLKSRR